MTTPDPDKAQEVQEKLAELLDNGWTVARVARELGVSTSSVYSWMNHGLDAKRAPLVMMALGHRMFDKPPSPTRRYKVPQTRDRLEALIERGWTMQVISEVLGTYRPSVTKWRKVGAGNRDRITALALSNPYFNARPPKRRWYRTNP